MIASISPYYAVKDPSNAEKIESMQLHGIWQWQPRWQVKVGSWIACTDPDMIRKADDNLTGDATSLERYYSKFMVKFLAAHACDLTHVLYGFSLDPMSICLLFCVGCCQENSIEWKKGQMPPPLLCVINEQNLNDTDVINAKTHKFSAARMKQLDQDALRVQMAKAPVASAPAAAAAAAAS